VPSEMGARVGTKDALCLHRRYFPYFLCSMSRGDPMKRPTVALGIVLAVALSVIPGRGIAASRPIVHAAEAQLLFRLQVSGPRDPSATYWVAYGPLHGRFGIKRLQPVANGLFEASQRLSPRTRTVFAYVAGHGAIKTRAGLAPGNPVVTIRVFGPAVIAPAGLPLVRWNTPIG